MDAFSDQREYLEVVNWLKVLTDRMPESWDALTQEELISLIQHYWEVHQYAFQTAVLLCRLAGLRGPTEREVGRQLMTWYDHDKWPWQTFRCVTGLLRLPYLAKSLYSPLLATDSYRPWIVPEVATGVRKVIHDGRLNIHMSDWSWGAFFDHVIQRGATPAGTVKILDIIRKLVRQKPSQMKKSMFEMAKIVNKDILKMFKELPGLEAVLQERQETMMEEDDGADKGGT